MNLTKDQLLGCVVAAFAKDFELRDFDTQSAETTIRVTISGDRYRISTCGFAERVDDGFLLTDSLARMISAILKPFIEKCRDEH